MTCPNCGNEIPPDANFCSSCGSPIENGPDQQDEGQSLEQSPQAIDAPGEGATGEVQLQSLQETVAGIVSELGHISDRISALELGRTTPASPAQGQAAALPPVRPVQQTAGRPGPSTPVTGTGTAPPPPPGGALDWLLGEGMSEKIGGWNWEWLLGGNWLARIGVVALVIGVGFFLKLAFDNNWIGETGRVALGIAVGLAFLGGGEFWQRRYPIWAQPLTGGGIAVLYLSIFAGFSFYQLIPPVVAFGLFFLITLAAAGLALRYESITIAVLGIIGGFITPLLLREQLPDQRLLLAYVLVLDLGVLALATFRNWRWFTLLGLLGSLGLFWFWFDQLEPGLLLAQVGITVIFLIFMGATTLFHILWRRVPGSLDQALMVINAAAYFGISYGLLFQEFRPWMGGFTLLLALLYGLLGYAVLLRSREQVYLSLFALGIGLVFLTIAVPVQLGGPWVSVAWAVEGAVLIWLSFILRMNQLRWFGLAVFLIFAAWLLFIDTPGALAADIQPFLNIYSAAYAVAIGITFLAAYLLHRERAVLETWEEYLFPAFLVAGNVFLTVAVPIQVSGIWIAVAWAIEGTVLMWLSFRLDLYQLRLFSLGVFAIVVVRLLAFDTLAVNSRTFQPVLNLRFLAFAVGIAAIYLSAYFLWRWRESYFDEQEKFFIPAFLVVASLLSLWLLSAEIIASVDSELFSVSRGIADNVKSLALSILWAIYAAILIVLGVGRRWRLVRLAGLGLLAVPVVKLFVFDVIQLEQGYRVAAFLSLGVILVAGGFLYQRYSRAIRGFLLE